MKVNIFNDGASIIYSRREISALDLKKVKADDIGESITDCMDQKNRESMLLSSLSIIIATNFCKEGTALYNKIIKGMPITIDSQDEDTGVCFVIESISGEKLVERTVNLQDYANECQSILDYFECEYMGSDKVKVYGGTKTLSDLGKLLPKENYISNIEGIYILNQKFYIIANCLGMEEEKISPYYLIEHGELFADRNKSIRIIPLIKP